LRAAIAKLTPLDSKENCREEYAETQADRPKLGSGLRRPNVNGKGGVFAGDLSAIGMNSVAYLRGWLLSPGAPGVPAAATPSTNRFPAAAVVTTKARSLD
jgi:hypothetical protein